MRAVQRRDVDASFKLHDLRPGPCVRGNREVHGEGPVLGPGEAVPRPKVVAARRGDTVRRCKKISRSRGV